MIDQSQDFAFLNFLLWITMSVGFGWGIRILYDMADHIGEIKGEIKAVKQRLEELSK